MPKLSENWLFTCAVIATLMAGVHPAVLSYVILVMGFLWLFIERDARGHFARPNTGTTVLFLLPLTYAAVALQWSLIPARGMYDLIVMAIVNWVGVQSTAGMVMIGKDDADRLMRVILSVFLAALIFFAMDLFFHLFVQRALKNTSWEEYLHLALATRSCFCIVLLLWPIVVHIWQRQWRASAVVLWLMVGVLTIFADTAAGRLAFAVSALVFLLANFSPRFVRVVFCAVIIVGFIVALPIARVAEDTIGDQAHRMSSSFGQRTEIWKFASKRIMEKPIFGWGFDSARAIPNFGEISVYQDNDPSKSIIPMHPHNWFLQVLLELGAVGGILVAAFWLWLISRTEKLHRSVQPAALAVIAVIFSIGAFSIGIWQVWWWAAVVFAMWVVQWLDRTQKKS